ARGRAGRRHSEQFTLVRTAHAQDRVHDEVHAEIAMVEGHGEGVDEERHVVDNDIDGSVTVRRRVDAYERFLRSAPCAEAPVLQRGGGKLLGRPDREVVVAELPVVGADERVGTRGIRRTDEFADLRHHVVATGHDADHTVHRNLVGTFARSRMLGNVDTAEALALALELADLADRLTMSRFRKSDLKVATKPDLTPVSEADEAVERAIRERLGASTGHLVLGEEFGTVAGDVLADSEYRWIVDPIDGTKSYVRGVPIWATLIGLERAGELIVGVASAPALGMRWWAGRGLGAFR